MATPPITITNHLQRIRASTSTTPLRILPPIDITHRLNTTTITQLATT
jgi:hypothetical protein